MSHSIGLKERNLNFLKRWYEVDKNKWFHKGELCDKARELGYLPETCGRRLRELEEEGFIISRSDKNIKSIEYQFNPIIKF